MHRAQPAEAAAGATGLIHASVSVSRRFIQGIPHLSKVNGHIQTMMDMQTAKSGRSCWLALRSSGGLPTDSVLNTGISSFAFQGTNAHAIRE